MRLRGFVLGAALLATGVAPAFAEIRIANDRGGQIGHYLQSFAMMRSTGERIVIDGNCLSACTLILGVIPRNRMCATHRARFGFHAAWMPDNKGRQVTSASGTRALWNIYPASVQRWITRHGGLSRKMIFLHGDDLSSIVPLCTHGPARTASHGPQRHIANGPPRGQHASRISRRSVRYVAGNTASDSR
jgi:hypothetical protein